MLEFDLVIIGGGPSGLIAAITAKLKYPQKNIVIIDKLPELAKKLLISGNGRCNITNKNLEPNSGKNYFGDTELINTTFEQFGFTSIISFFENLGIRLYEEEKNNLGKMFPVNNDAASVKFLLEKKVKDLKIVTMLETQVTKIQKNNIVFNITIQKEFETTQIQSQNVIISAGGRAYPSFGSDGSGYSLASSLSHSIIKPVPSAVPLESKNEFSQKLQGQKIRAGLRTEFEGKVLNETIGDLIFTKYGFSGSGILNISRQVSIKLNRENKNIVDLFVDLIPDLSQPNLTSYFEQKAYSLSHDNIISFLAGFFSLKCAYRLCALFNFEPETKLANLSQAQREYLIKSLKQQNFKITSTRGWNECEFSSGGINTDEINVKTLESKLVNGLYFAGEILDVDGNIGGFNLSWAWASGFVAGNLN